MSIPAQPNDYHTLTPYLIIDGAARAIEWYSSVFGAHQDMRLDAPGDRVGHAELRIGDSKVMLADAHPEMGIEAPGTFGGSPVSLHLYLPDVDAVVAKAAAAGATVKNQPEDKFYGDRLGTIVDPFGHTWHVSTHIEDVSEEEIGRRLAAMSQKA